MLPAIKDTVLIFVYKKAVQPISVTLAGMVMLSSCDLQKAPTPIVLRLLPSVTFFKPVQAWKALYPIETTELGMITSSSE
ncbi:hypothetical protein Barb7_02641 [Bacteroidales bacterium Barb7]|nr:hypothetical protein Barb7_02641 [Bacteroidales bacterium Barb7]